MKIKKATTVPLHNRHHRQEYINQITVVLLFLSSDSFIIHTFSDLSKGFKQKK